jgi:hypothetical protein
MATERIWLEGQQQDFLLYIENEMNLTVRGEYRDHVVAQVLERADGNFLWLHLAVRKINECHTKQEVQTALANLPVGMYGVYDRMANLVQEHTNANHRRLGQAILGWATCARRPLSVKELEDAIRDSDDNSELLEVGRSVEVLCGGFVVVDNEDRIAMLHETARAYLTGSLSQENTERPCVIKPRIAHDVLFKRCMACLTQPDLRNLLEGGESPILFDYSMSSWFIHFSQGTCMEPSGAI